MTGHVVMSDLDLLARSQNHKLRPIIDDGEGDVALWNKEIAKYFQGELLIKSLGSNNRIFV